MKLIKYVPARYTTVEGEFTEVTFYYNNGIFTHKYVFKGLDTGTEIKFSMWRYPLFTERPSNIYLKRCQHNVDSITFEHLLEELEDWFKYEEGINHVRFVKDGFKPWIKVVPGDIVRSYNNEEYKNYTVLTTITSRSKGGTKWFECITDDGEKYGFTVYNTDLNETTLFESGIYLESKSEI